LSDIAKYPEGKRDFMAAGRVISTNEEHVRLFDMMFELAYSAGRTDAALEFRNAFNAFLGLGGKENAKAGSEKITESA